MPHLLIVALLGCTAFQARAVSATALHRDIAAEDFCDQAKASCQRPYPNADQPR